MVVSSLSTRTFLIAGLIFCLLGKSQSDSKRNKNCAGVPDKISPEHLILSSETGCASCKITPTNWSTFQTWHHCLSLQRRSSHQKELQRYHFHFCSCQSVLISFLFQWITPNLMMLDSTTLTNVLERGREESGRVWGREGGRENGR